MTDKQKNISRVLLIFSALTVVMQKLVYTQDDFGINAPCNDTVLYTPSINDIVQTKYESRIDGFYINDTKVDKHTYIYFTQLSDSIDLYRQKKESMGCYIIFFNNDSIKTEEGHFYGECFRGLYKSYHKNGNAKEEGEFAHKKYCAKVGKWKYYNENKVLIREEFYEQSDIQEEIDAKYFFKVGSWSYWDDKGNLLKQEFYKSNELIDTKEYLPKTKKEN